MERFELEATLARPSDFQNFFLGPLRAPEEAPGRGKSSELASSIGERHAAQDHLIFTMDSVVPCPPTLLIWSDSGRRTGHCKYGVIRAGAPLRRTLGRRRRRKKFFKKAS